MSSAAVALGRSFVANELGATGAVVRESATELCKLKKSPIEQAAIKHIRQQPAPIPPWPKNFNALQTLPISKPNQEEKLPSPNFQPCLVENPEVRQEQVLISTKQPANGTSFLNEHYAWTLSNSRAKQCLSTGTARKQELPSHLLNPSADDEATDTFWFLCTLLVTGIAQAETLATERCFENPHYGVLLDMNPFERTACLRDLTKLLTKAEASEPIAWPESGNLRKLLESARAENSTEFDLRTFKMFLDPVHDKVNAELNDLVPKLSALMIEHPVLPYTPEIRRVSDQIQHLCTQRLLLQKETQKLARFLPLHFARFTEKVSS